MIQAPVTQIAKIIFPKFPRRSLTIEVSKSTLPVPEGKILVTVLPIKPSPP